MLYDINVEDIRKDSMKNITPSPTSSQNLRAYQIPLAKFLMSC